MYWMRCSEEYSQLMPRHLQPSSPMLTIAKPVSLGRARQPTHLWRSKCSWDKHASGSSSSSICSAGTQIRSSKPLNGPSSGRALRNRTIMAASTSTVSADVHTARIAVVSIPGCPYCNRSKEALRTSGYEFVNVDVSGNEPLRQRVRELTSQRTVPQVCFSRKEL